MSTAAAGSDTSWTRHAPTIVLTGGPCAGKSKLVATLPSLIAKRTGLHSITIPETVSWMGAHGMRREDFPGIVAFQTAQTMIQAAHEGEAIEASRLMGRDDTIILMDRAIPDAAAYLDADGYAAVLAANGLSPEQVMRRYDAVIFLHSVACGHETLYHARGNAMRIERDADDAISADARTLNAYQGHPRMFEIHDTETIGEKAERVMEAICRALGDGSAVRA